jgi:hypothetical protein
MTDRRSLAAEDVNELISDVLTHPSANLQPKTGAERAFLEFPHFGDGGAPL